MPFCTQCGNRVSPADAFCGACGRRQPGAPPPPRDFLRGLSPRTASLLCYIPFLGWIAPVVILATDRFRGEPAVRFHAFQGLFLYICWLMVDWVLDPVFAHAGSVRWMPGLFKLSIIAAWIIGLIRTAQELPFRIPIIGEIADRAATEQ